MERFKRFRANEACPVCQHRGASCAASLGGEVVLCLRVETGSFGKAKGSMGFYHRLIDRPKDAPIYRAPQVAPKPVPRPTTASMAETVRKSQESMTDALWTELSQSLGLRVEDLLAMGTGYIESYTVREPDRMPYEIRGQWSFPMVDGLGRVIGVRTRDRVTHAKKALPGSHNGLFVPSVDFKVNTTWVLPEGPTSCAAALQLGFAAIGRPNNRAGAEYMIQMLRRHDGKRRVKLVIVCDDDEAKTLPDGSVYHAGQDGGMAFGLDVMEYAKETRVIVTPRASFSPTSAQCKDLREYVAAPCSGLAERFSRVVRMSQPLFAGSHSRTGP